MGVGERAGLGVRNREREGARGPPGGQASMSEHDERTRIDKWLWAARFFKTRSLAAQAVEAGKVLLNDARVKPAKPVHPNDMLQIRTPVFSYVVRVVQLSDKRGSATIAATLYSETEESRRQREQAREAQGDRHPGAFLRGRPTKRERRQMDRLHDDTDE